MTADGGQDTWRLAISNVMAEVAEANRSLEAFLDAHGAQPGAVFNAVLALEEAVTNVIKYSYDDDHSHEIVLEAEFEPAGVVLRVTDDGHEFNPLDAPPPDLDRPVEEREVGGLGIHLLRNLTRKIDYERRGGKNVLTMYLSHKPEPD